MGLDLIVEGCAKAGHEAEWRKLLEQAFDGLDLTDANTARFQAISTPPFARLGRPRAAAEAAAAAGRRPEQPSRRGLLARLGLGGKPREREAFEDQLDIVRSAGRWFVFWGARGHAIRAWS